MCVGMGWVCASVLCIRLMRIMCAMRVLHKLAEPMRKRFTEINYLGQLIQSLI